LMRTNANENRRLGEIFAEKANAASGPVGVLVPLKGVSILDGDGQLFCDRAADDAMFDALRKNLRPEIPFVEMDVNINDSAFSERAVFMLRELIAQSERRAATDQGVDA